MAGLHHLNQVYEEIKGNAWPLVNLYRSIRAAGMNSSAHVTTLLKIANNDLPTFEYRYVILKNEVNLLQEKKRTLYNQVTEEGSNLEYYRIQSQREIDRFKALQERRKKAESLVIHFENNNSEYLKIEKTVEEKLRDQLSNKRGLLKLAALCITESMRVNPDKYRYLIPQDKSPAIDYSTPCFNPFWMSEQSYLEPQQQPQYQSKAYFMEDYVSMLLEDSEKLLEKLVKELGQQIINDCDVSTSVSKSVNEIVT